MASKKQDNRATNWALTMNMDTVRREYLDDCIGNAIRMGWEVQGQEEVGKEGTRHYQVHLHTPQVRFSQVKKVFPTAYIEVARNKFASANYSHKPETRVGEIDFKNIENKFVQYKDVRDKFYQWLIQDYEAPEMMIDRTEVWDKFIGLSIEEGIECDVIGVNPQYRSCIQKYWLNEIRKARLKKTASADKDILDKTISVDRQTDSQTDKTNSADSSITDDASSSGDEEQDTEEQDEDFQTEDDEEHVEWIEDESLTEGSETGSDEDR